MKIKEFIEKVNKVAYAKKDGDCIYICDGETTSYQDYYFLAFLVTSKSMDLDWEWRYLRYTDACELRTILNLVKELQDTPVKERFPEKKYVLSAMRYDGGPIAIKQYVTGFYANSNCTKFNFGSKGYAQEYTDKDLNNLSEWFPKEALEAMKEPVEDN
ncbi:hypothetical protein FOL80_09590 [Lactobacillus reuteri]|uniref:hypothetical protein n=1 Tax=Limosilactobacillus reuteri TaxID=1598 RepID=UPI00146B8B00|nr:hypothetical protein [Limosilactobacillus reuteri]NMV49362.1 hypothetical protein [Limosilactobacillus reuteri]NMV50989.1 hypothetical protein [Limosilactobacillus reuteri]NMV60602.1 hypothetical protein [Limosilactobacillus reuteri]NMV64169.1 hypothetical protein [Limosilactobacillus reuteri]NMV67759.1 hypothetical protein [Limosilactobacillus reuteri]